MYHFMIDSNVLPWADMGSCTNYINLDIGSNLNNKKYFINLVFDVQSIFALFSQVQNISYTRQI